MNFICKHCANHQTLTRITTFGVTECVWLEGVCICLLLFVLDNTFYITYTLHNLTPIESPCKLNNCFIGRHFYKSLSRNAYTVWYLRESLNKEFELLIMQTRNYLTKMYTISSVNVKSIKKRTKQNLHQKSFTEDRSDVTILKIVSNLKFNKRHIFKACKRSAL